MDNHWLEEAKKRLETESAHSGDEHFKKLQAQGIIDERGEVTGRVHRWSAFLAITAVKHVAKKVAAFRCLNPTFGMPGGATIDVRRDSMVDYLRKGKKIITASWDSALKMWKEGSEVRLSSKGFIRTDRKDESQDDLGPLPEFHQVDSRL